MYDDEGTELALKVFENDEDNDTLDSGTLRELSILRLLRGSNGHNVRCTTAKVDAMTTLASRGRRFA